MRGAFVDQGRLFSCISPEARVPASRPLRTVRELVRDVLGELNRSLSKLYASEGRPSIPPEQLLSALLLQVFYGVWSERQLMEQLDYNLLYRWFVGRRGTRPRQPADQRYESAYLFGAICPARGTGAAFALPFADTEAMQLHLDEISRRVVKGAHAVLLLDRAGWHGEARGSKEHHADLPAVSRTRAEPGREHLAISARQLALKPRLR